MTETSTSSRGAYAKTAERREAILRAASRLYAEQGYTSTSIRDVATTAGMSEAGVRHHFPTKLDLLQSILAEREADDLAQTASDLDGEGVLLRLLDIVRANTGKRHTVELYAALSAEATTESHPAHGYFVRRYSWVHGLLVDAASDLATKGRLHTGMRPSTFARATVALIDGLQLQWLLDPGVDMPGELETFIRLHVDLSDRD